jgi:hypothetical protein
MVATTMCGVCSTVPVFAQSNSDHLWNNSFVSAQRAGRTATSVVRVYSPDSAVETAAALPRNLEFPSQFQAVLEQMLRESPTFRRQCLRLGNATGLTVRLLSSQGRLPDRVRARTLLRSTRGGKLEATIELPLLPGLPELIAHEFEHVIEQLDGVDLRLRASLPNTGVHQRDDGAFETVRAVRAGLTVAGELAPAGR